MSILTIAWSTAGAMCLTLALMHFYIWLRKREVITHLLFALSALGAGASAFFELEGLLAGSVPAYAAALKAQPVAVAVLLISMVWFLVVYFGTAKKWLAGVITALWAAAILLNFVSPIGIVLQSISELRHTVLPWGERFTIAIGATNPWKYATTEPATVLFLIFVVDASLRLWRQGDRQQRRRALSIGGSIVFFTVVAGIHAPLVDEGIIKTPYIITFTFLAIIFAMGFELSNDVIRSAELSQEVKANERRWRTLLENVQLLVVGMDQAGNINYVNPNYLQVTGFPAQEILGKPFTNLLSEPDRQTLWERFVASNKNEVAPHYQQTIITKNGKERIIAWSNVGLHDREGGFIGMLGVGADITEREKAFEEIQRLQKRLQEENIYLQEEIILDHNHRSIIGKSNTLRYALTRVEQVAPTDTSVLIEGETGVGKELFARAVHHDSPRKDRPLVKVNCAAIPANLIESELFGHEKGAFTGADKLRKGRFELADGGTIFLDEIGELPVELQPKLLRVLEDGEFERLGSNQTIKVNVRLIAATNRKLEEQVQAGRFREDLYYRLSAYPISVPPLRKRKEDIQPLVQFFVDGFARKMGKHIEKIPRHTLEMLENYPWPGNVRELRNVIERAVIATRGNKLLLADNLAPATSPDGEATTVTHVSLEDLERNYITHILTECYWRVEGEKGAAKILKLHPNTLRNRMQKLGIKKPE